MIIHARKLSILSKRILGLYPNAYTAYHASDLKAPFWQGHQISSWQNEYVRLACSEAQVWGGEVIITLKKNYTENYYEKYSTPSTMPKT